MKFKTKFCITVFISLLISNAFPVFGICSILSTPETNEILTSDPYYSTAYLEICEMLDGKRPIDFKRAVFLAEWAYLRGDLDYSEYCNEISKIVSDVSLFIATNNLAQYKTGGNVALFEFFCRPYSMNGHMPYTYDYDDFGGQEDLSKLFVTKLMRTHSGQCRSLPMFYKVLAEEMGIDAHISLAPQHLFIRHKDEEGNWVNVELTNHGISKDAFYITNFGINAEAIRNKIYMWPLTTEETLSFLLSEMLIGYQRLFGMDDFSLQCADKSLEHYPININALCVKDGILRTRGLAHLERNGRVVDEMAIINHNIWRENREKLEGLGYTEMAEEIYERLLRTTEEQARLKAEQANNN